MTLAKTRHAKWVAKGKPVMTDKQRQEWRESRQKPVESITVQLSDADKSEIERNLQAGVIKF